MIGRIAVIFLIFHLRWSWYDLWDIRIGEVSNWKGSSWPLWLFWFEKFGWSMASMIFIFSCKFLDITIDCIMCKQNPILYYKVGLSEYQQKWIFGVLIYYGYKCLQGLLLMFCMLGPSFIVEWIWVCLLVFLLEFWNVWSWKSIF